MTNYILLAQLHSNVLNQQIHTNSHKVRIGKQTIHECLTDAGLDAEHPDKPVNVKLMGVAALFIDDISKIKMSPGQIPVKKTTGTSKNRS